MIIVGSSIKQPTPFHQNNLDKRSTSSHSFGKLNESMAKTAQRLIKNYEEEFPHAHLSNNTSSHFDGFDMRALKSVKASGGDFQKLYKRMKDRSDQRKQKG